MTRICVDATVWHLQPYPVVVTTDISEISPLYSTTESLIVFAGHLPVHPDSTDPICLAWNYSELLSILQSHRSVVCFMAGHDHDGGYHRDASGIHYLTLEGVIETPPESNAFGTMHVYADRMVLKGNGRISDRVLAYPGNL